MKKEDIAKVVFVFIIGLTSAFDLCYYHPASTKKVEHIDIPLASWGYVMTESKTNSVLHLPLVRIGSGIR